MGPGLYAEAGGEDLAGLASKLRARNARFVRVCAENELDLPTLLIIDTPMKNIGEDVDAALFHGFYRYLYSLADSGLGETQLLIIDKEFEPPPSELDSSEIFMERGDPEHPPLVPYYDGP